MTDLEILVDDLPLIERHFTDQSNTLEMQMSTSIPIGEGRIEPELRHLFSGRFLGVYYLIEIPGSADRHRMVRVSVDRTPYRMFSPISGGVHANVDLCRSMVATKLAHLLSAHERMELADRHRRRGDAGSAA